MDKKIQFFKNKIIARLDELKPFMSDVKYRLYISIINDCTNIDDIRDMAELDMQFNMIKYVNEIADKLKLSNTNIGELEAVTNQNIKAAKITIIEPKKKEAKSNAEIANEIDLSTLEEDLEDEEILASAANMLMMRLKIASPEELYNEDEEDDAEIDIDYMIEELDYNEDEPEESKEETNKKKDQANQTEINPDDEIIDFGMDDKPSKDKEDNTDNINIDELEFEEEEDNSFNNIDDLEFEEEEDYEANEIEEDAFSNIDELDFDDEEEDYEAEEEEDALDSIDNLDFEEEDYEAEEEDSPDSENEEDTFNSVDNLDFEEEDYEAEDDSDDNEEDTFDSIDNLDFEEEENDYEAEDDSDDNEEDTFNSIDNLDFEEENDYEAEDDETDDENILDDIDNIDTDNLFSDEVEDEPEEDNDNMFDIDESELSFDGPDDEEEDTFENFFKNNKENTANKTVTPIKRELTTQRVFINGTKRGDQTQQMFNILTGIFNKTGKFTKKVAANTATTVKRGMQKANNSSYFKLS